MEVKQYSKDSREFSRFLRLPLNGMCNEFRRMDFITRIRVMQQVANLDPVLLQQFNRNMAAILNLN